MLQITPHVRILVAIEPVDLRKGIDGLAQLCREKLREDPFSGCLFVFRGRRATTIKLLQFDGQGFILAQKRLSKGRFCVVAVWVRTSTFTGGVSSATVGRRRESGHTSGSDVAPSELVLRSKEVLAFKQIFCHTPAVPTECRYRGREIRSSEIAFLRELINEHPELSRYALSKKVCEAWQWKQANGELCDMICRGLLLMLDRAGAIQLPAARCGSRNRPEGRDRPEPLVPDNRPVRGPLSELGGLEFQQVRRTPQEPLFNSLLEQYHYLRYQQPVGEHLKYLVSAKGQVIACLAWCSAPRHLASRDRFIGWSAEARKRNLRLLAYNTRFLILPWVAVPHLASRILGRMAKIVPRDWQQMYAHPVYWLETFIDPARFKGTCYRAANWLCLGTTTGRGHNARTNKRTQPVKELFGLPLTSHFREVLSRL
jgi:hypothetical protein